ncbi:MAG: UDP-N-acetylmuramoyl-L-alanine--D-glutamate ligase [Acidobacteria bacterium]|nr:UDP-N-acetylmuramoyl-L-alanine--D-glutamate ligase [Acidobacteriota bacterium]
MNIEGKRVLVVGLGGSGVAAANLLSRKRAQVCVTDLKNAAELRSQVERLEKQVSVCLGGHPVEEFTKADFIVLSPGVPLSVPQLQTAIKKGIPVYSEVELAYQFIQGKIIGITGSNGKTTSTTLIGELLKNGGFSCVVAGNIGSDRALSQFVDNSSKRTMFVVELSSFQLETIKDFKCDIAVLLNITPDHLDRYSSFEEYARAKERIFLNQDSDGYAVINADSEPAFHMAAGRRARVFLFSRNKDLAEGAFIRAGNLVIRWNGTEQRLMPVHEVRLKGSHNLDNVLASAAAGYLSGVSGEIMAKTFRNFAGVEHRLELVRTLKGIEFYNDSKATNVDSTLQAFSAFEQPLIAIMGGRDKGGDFSVLGDVVKRHVKLIVLIGEASGKIAAALKGIVSFAQAQSMQEAVELAFRSAREGDAVLLSPGCASFDMFENFEHRGRVFKEAVSGLA